MPYIGISEDDRKIMLQQIGVSSIDGLFMDIPENLLLKRDLNLESGYSEWDLVRYFDKLAKKNNVEDINDFKGAGCYKHHVPSLVKAIAARGEFLTSYTPYQAEVSQGTLEAIYRFQSYISDLTGMDITNASMYDGATALAEAVTMSYRLDKNRKIYLSGNIHPEYLAVTCNYLDSLEIRYQVYNSPSLDSVENGSTIVIQNPDFYGEFMNHDSLSLLSSTVQNKNLFLIVVIAEAYALVCMEKPSNWGAQIVCGSVQSFGNSRYYGGAQIGFISSKIDYVRQLPGRIIGKTTDRRGKEGYVLTFQTREQHIKRERASSNICTNQSLHALCVAVYLSLMGAQGLRNIAKDIWVKTKALKDAMESFPDLEIKTNGSFNEFLVVVKNFQQKNLELTDLLCLLSQSAVPAERVSGSLADRGLYLFCVSETHNLDDLNSLLKKISLSLSKHGTNLPMPKIEQADILKNEKLFSRLNLPEINIKDRSELEVCRYFTKLSQKNFSIDTHFYPLGSCTMKYNPKVNDEIASHSAWTEIHPYQDDEQIQGALEILDELNKSLCEITGFYRFSLQPAAGAHGEYAALLMAKKYFTNKQEARDIVLVPDSAHGTNPASATMAGFKTITVKSTAEGDVDLDDLRQILNKHRNKIAVFMLTNPSTLGLFCQNILEITKLIHGDGGLMYYDGANLNAIAGISRPGDMGFDLLHLNLHKTFSTPHGGGGPGAGPVGASKELAPYLPAPELKRRDDGSLYWDKQNPKSVGRIRSFYGNFNVLIRALAYIKRNGKEGIKRIGETATLNANYLQARIKTSPILSQDEIFVPYVTSKQIKKPCKHEFIISAAKLKEKYGITALDIAKRLLDKGIHAPTVYFPLTVPEAIMIEPTETESKESLDMLVRAFEEIILEAQTPEGRETIKTAPHSTEFSRFDEVRAVKQPVLRS